MVRTLALAAALGLSTLATAASKPSPEQQVNARLDAQLHRTLHRLALEAAEAEMAAAQPGSRLGRPASPASRLLAADPLTSR
jgi:hypothetical protein